STKEIVDFTKHFAPGGEEIEPFTRSGNKPMLIHLQNEKNKAAIFINHIQDLMNRDNEMVALICKTLEESKQVYELLKGQLPIHLIDEETYTFEKGILVLPVYLAKGIEFDAVIIPDASKEKYHLESDKSLFYTACTRAMHSLTMFSFNKTSPFIDNTPERLYEVKVNLLR